MCWQQTRVKSAQVPRGCDRCKKLIHVGQPYTKLVHIPNGNCSHYDSRRDIDLDCSEVGFRTQNLHDACYMGEPY